MKEISGYFCNALKELKHTRSAVSRTLYESPSFEVITQLLLQARVVTVGSQENSVIVTWKSGSTCITRTLVSLYINLILLLNHRRRVLCVGSALATEVHCKICSLVPDIVGTFHGMLYWL